MIDLKLSQNPVGLAKQLIFDCAMELIYHTEHIDDEVIGNKLLEILRSMDEINLFYGDKYESGLYGQR